MSAPVISLSAIPLLPANGTNPALLNLKAGRRSLADRALWLPRRLAALGKWLVSGWRVRTIFVLFIAVGVTGAWIGTRVSVRQTYNEIKSVHGQPPRKGGMYFYGGMQRWDLVTRSLTLNWAPQWCPGTSWCTGYLENHVLIFTDVDALGIDGFDASKATANIQSQGESTGVKKLWVQSIELVVKEWPKRGEASNLVGIDTDALYPFDFYTLKTLIAAVDANDLNHTYPVHGADIVNWVQSDWIASYYYEYIDRPGRGAVLRFTVVMQRHPIVKATAILIAVINWMLTISLAYTTVTFLRGKRQFPLGMDGVALMFTALFALPTVRSTMPGNPPLGCLLDALGIIPNLLIVSLCGTCLILHRMRVDAPPREVASLV